MENYRQYSNHLITLNKSNMSYYQNIIFYCGEAGTGKTRFAKEKILEEVVNNKRIFVFESENEYKTIRNITVFEDRNNFKEPRDSKDCEDFNFFLSLNKIYENMINVSNGNTETIIIVENFNRVCKTQEEQIKFLEHYRKMVCYGCQFILVIQDLELIHEIPRPCYMQYCKELHYFPIPQIPVHEGTFPHIDVYGNVKKQWFDSEEKKRLESKLRSLKQQRDFLLPKGNKSIFGKEKIETVAINRMLRAEKLTEEILMLENELREQFTIY